MEVRNVSEELKEKVWDLERCTGCGLCVAVCNKDVLRFEEDLGEHPAVKEFKRSVGLREVELDPCELCDKPCVEICPKLYDEWKPREAVRVISLKSKVTGDVIKDLLLCALDLGAIRGVLAVEVDKWSLTPMSVVITQADQLKKISTITSPILAPIMLKLNRAPRMEKLAVVGPPCVAQGIVRVKASTCDMLEQFRRPNYLVISYFCYGAYAHDLIQRLSDKLVITPWDVTKVKVSFKDLKLMVDLHEGTVKMPLTETIEYLRKGCARCTDFAGEQADIAIGDVGSSPGWMTAIIRSHLGELVVSAAAKLGYVEISAHARAKADMEELKGFIEAKKKRAAAEGVDEAFLALSEGLKSPERRDEALKRLEETFEVRR